MANVEHSTKGFEREREVRRERRYHEKTWKDVRSDSPDPRDG
jgi:hypothetical protein